MRPCPSGVHVVPKEESFFGIWFVPHALLLLCGVGFKSNGGSEGEQSSWEILTKTSEPRCGIEQLDIDEGLKCCFCVVVGLSAGITMSST